jgi:uncharacterized protein (TIGR03437 family)
MRVSVVSGMEFRRPLWLVCLVCFTLAPLRAQTTAQLSVGSPSTQPDGTVIVPVQLTSAGLQVAAVQFDISVDNSVASLALTIGSSGSSASKDIHTAGVAGPALRVVLAGMNQNTIADGTLVSLFVTPAAAGFSGTVNVFNTVASDGAGSNLSISGTSTGGPAGGTVSVVNAASYKSGPVAPGEMVSLFQTGMLPGAAAASDVTLTFDGTVAPILFAGTDQINAVAPFALSGKSSAAVAVIYQGQPVAQATVPVAAVAPAVFSENGSGSGQALAVNVDGTLNSVSNQAARGSTITLYGTGGGIFNPPLADGQILPSNAIPTSQLTVKSGFGIGGKDAKVQYIGPAPGMIAGLLQINVLIPATVTPGSAVAFTLFLNGNPSQAGLTIAVK